MSRKLGCGPLLVSHWLLSLQSSGEGLRCEQCSMPAALGDKFPRLVGGQSGWYHSQARGYMLPHGLLASLSGLGVQPQVQSASVCDVLWPGSHSTGYLAMMSPLPWGHPCVSESFSLCCVAGPGLCAMLWHRMGFVTLSRDR